MNCNIYYLWTIHSSNGNPYYLHNILRSPLRWKFKHKFLFTLPLQQFSQKGPNIEHTKHRRVYTFSFGGFFRSLGFVLFSFRHWAMFVRRNSSTSNLLAHTTTVQLLYWEDGRRSRSFFALKKPKINHLSKSKRNISMIIIINIIAL